MFLEFVGYGASTERAVRTMKERTAKNRKSERLPDQSSDY